MKRNKSAKRTDPALWEAVKAEVTAGSKGGRPGQWSARKAQMSVRLYKERGGGYLGPKDPDNSLTKWTKQKWRTKSGRPSLETGERYLPSDAIDALTDEEYAETTRAKRRGTRKGQQFVKQPKKIARKVKKFRRNADRWKEVDSSLFRGSGANVTSESKALKYAESMRRQGGWGNFPPVHAHVGTIDEDDVDEYNEADEKGYAHELDYNRPLTRKDIGRDYVLLEDGHHRAWAAYLNKIPIRVKIWPKVRNPTKRRNTDEPRPVPISALPTYLYHATHLGKIQDDGYGIAEDGLVPSGGSQFSGGYDFHSRGRVFFSGKTGVPFWFDSMERIAEYNSEFKDIENVGYWTPVVLRIATQYRSPFYKDKLGERDSRRPAFFTTEAIEPEGIDIWDGDSWVSVEDADIEGMMDEAGEAAQYEYDDDEYDGWYNPEFNLFAPKGV